MIEKGECIRNGGGSCGGFRNESIRVNAQRVFQQKVYRTSEYYSILFGYLIYSCDSSASIFVGSFVFSSCFSLSAGNFNGSHLLQLHC